MSEASEGVRVLIADDHPVFRQGLAQVIGAEPDLRVEGVAGDGAAALALLESLRPDVAVLDVDMPKLGGFDVARAARERGLEVRVLFLTMYKDEDIFNAAMDLGVAGYVLKDSAVDDIVAAIRAVALGRHYISPEISGYLVNRLAPGSRSASPGPALAELTQAERRVLGRIATGETSKEIADALFVSVRTVENHRANICAKLGLRGSHALVKFAIEHRSRLG